MVQLLSDHPFMRMQFLDDAKMRDFANMVQWREPMVDDIISFLDRVSFPVQCMDKRISQNAMYCGYNCGTMVNNVFAYAQRVRCFLQPLTFQGAGRTGV